MINPIEAITGGVKDSSQPKLIEDISASKDQFLKMMLAQLENQDPFKAQDAEKFSEQMTQFGQLEQMFNMNSTLNQLLANQPNSERGDAIGIIGKDVAYEGSTVSIQGEHKGKLGYKLDIPGGNVELKIFDKNGNEVRVIHQENVSEGLQMINFDGKDKTGADLPDGEYHFVADVISSSEDDIPLSTYVGGNAVGVQFTEIGAMVEVNGTLVPLSAIASVQQV